MTLILFFFFASIRCCSPGEASDWSLEYSTETDHAQPDNSGRLRPEHHQRSRLRLRVLVLRGGRADFITCILTSVVNTVHIGFVISMHRSVSRFLNVVFDYVWQFLRWKATSCFWWEHCFVLMTSSARSALLCIWHNGAKHGEKLCYKKSLKKWDIQNVFQLKVHAFRKVIKGWDD